MFIVGIALVAGAWLSYMWSDFVTMEQAWGAFGAELQHPLALASMASGEG